MTIEPVVTPSAGVGPQDPATGTPARALGSVRRTSSVDVTRPEGQSGPIHLEGHARDLVTPRDGPVRIAGAIRLRAELTPTQELVAISTDPPAGHLDALVGRTVGAGFRGAAAEAAATDRRGATLRWLLLDDLPVATLVSGYAMQRAGLVPDAPRAAYEPVVDLCAGWAQGGTLMRVLDDAGTPPMTLGPRAPFLESGDDPRGWHRLPALAPRTVRRRRRIDVNRTTDRALAIDAMFRDSHVDDDLVETVVHEYALRATVDPATGVVTEAEARPRVLPYLECPGAAVSAARVVGMPIAEVRDRVRADLVGTSTCTHLNDLLRSLGDVAGMAVPA